MHIGFFTDGYVPQLNGVATSIEILTAVLQEQGQTVSVFAPAMGNYEDHDRGIHRFPSIKAVKDPPLWVSAPLSTRVFSEIPRLGLDIVHTHSPFSFHFIGCQVARLERLPLVYTYHTLLPAHVNTIKLLNLCTVPPALAEWYSAWTSNICDHVVAPSEKIKELLERYGVHRPISVIHNGIRIERFQNQTHGNLRSRLGLPESAKILLTVGRLTPEKNVGFLVNALARVCSVNASVYLVHVGQGPLKSQLQDQAGNLGIGDRLILAGPLLPTEMPKVYADADIYVTASLSEAHSIAALEALVSGLPFVVVRDQSLALMVEDGQNGYVVDLDVEQFAARILNILDKPELSARMREHSLGMAMGFSAEEQARKLTDLYGKLIEEKRLRHK